MTIRSVRVALFTIGSLLIVSAAGYWTSRDIEAFLPGWVWPPCLLLAGIACIMFALRTESAFWWQASRILVVVAVLSRSFSILLRALGGELPSAGAGLGAACVFLASAGAFNHLWSTTFRYWSQRAALAE